MVWEGWSQLAPPYPDLLRSSTWLHGVGKLALRQTVAFFIIANGSCLPYHLRILIPRKMDSMSTLIKTLLSCCILSTSTGFALA